MANSLTGFAFYPENRFSLERMDKLASKANAELENGEVIKPTKMIWGPETNGFQLALEFSGSPNAGAWCAGSKFTYKVWIRNSSGESQIASDFVPVRGWFPELRHEENGPVSLPWPAWDFPNDIRSRRLATGDVAEIGDISVQLPTDLKPGRYICTQSYRIMRASMDDLPLTVSANVQLEPFPEVEDREAKRRKTAKRLF